MRKLAVTANITVDGVINGGVGRFIPRLEEDVDQSDVHEVLAP